MIIIKKIIEVINSENNNSFLVVSHTSPDGDAVGSSLALYHSLKKLGKKAEVSINDEIPTNLLFLPGAKNIIKFNGERFFDVIIVVDCSDLRRVGIKNIQDCCKILINIDHHQNNENFGDVNYVKTNVSSVGEIIYVLLDSMEIDISKNIALNLYTAILTDTGSFRYSNTYPSTHKIASELLDRGINPDEVYREIYEKKSLESLKLLSLALKLLKVNKDKNIAWVSLKNEDIKQLKVEEKDFEGLVNYPRIIDGVEVAVLFREKENNLIKVSLRSNSWLDVGKIAYNLGGGGHKRASGCELSGNIREVEKLVLNEIEKYMYKQTR